MINQPPDPTSFGFEPFTWTLHQRKIGRETQFRWIGSDGIPLSPVFADIEQAKAWGEKSIREILASKES